MNMHVEETMRYFLLYLENENSGSRNRFLNYYNLLNENDRNRFCRDVYDRGLIGKLKVALDLPAICFRVCC